MTIQLAHKKKAPPPTFLGHYAGFVSRLIAFVIDILIVSFAIGIMLGGGRLILNFFNFDPLAFLSSDAAVSHLTLRNILLFMTSFTFTFFVNMVYTTFFWMAAGKTIGKAIMGLQVTGPKGCAHHVLAGYETVYRLLDFSAALISGLFLGVGE
ncbi:MAG: RDD family protein [Chloroflexi bacterium]|nr:RDD family protein [Chloroflexota bacterium]